MCRKKTHHGSVSLLIVYICVGVKDTLHANHSRASRLYLSYPQQLWLWFQDAVSLSMCVWERENEKDTHLWPLRGGVTGHRVQPCCRYTNRDDRVCLLAKTAPSILGRACVCACVQRGMLYYLYTTASLSFSLSTVGRFQLPAAFSVHAKEVTEATWGHARCCEYCIWAVCGVWNCHGVCYSV